MTEETPEPRKYGKLSVNINDETARIFQREMAYETDLNATEIVRRAISLYGLMQEERRAGYIVATAYRKWDCWGDRFHKVASIIRMPYPARDGMK